MKGYVELLEAFIAEATVPTTEYGYWLSPEGEFHVVGFQAHGAVATKLGFGWGWTTKYKEGWVRIGSHLPHAPGLLALEYGEKSLSARTISAIRRLCAAEDFSVFVCDILNFDGKPATDKRFESASAFLLSLQEQRRPVNKPASE